MPVDMELEAVLRPIQYPMAPYPPKVITLANGKKMVIRQAAREDVRVLAIFLDDYHVDREPAVMLPLRKSLKQFVTSLAELDVLVEQPEPLGDAREIAGDREVPDHPLVRQAIGDCLNEAMDLGGLERVLARIESGDIRVVASDLTEPSPLALEVLSARPYAYLDDAPLEERRTQAVMSRRWLSPEAASDIGRLDPEAIARVRAEAWPEATNADELHDVWSCDLICERVAVY